MKNHIKATATGALPKSFGFAAPTDGHVRRLTAAEEAAQQRAIAERQKGLRVN
jgi:hypothetical protein